MFDADVVGLRVSPGIADGEAALGGLRHELQFDPFAALFEAGEAFPMFHCVLTVSPVVVPVCPLLEKQIPTLRQAQGRLYRAAY